LASEDRAAITRAADVVEAALRRDPISVGESRKDNKRIVIETPLVIRIEVDLGKSNGAVSAVFGFPNADAKQKTRPAPGHGGSPRCD
jgi:hypothetical protein